MKWAERSCHYPIFYIEKLSTIRKKVEFHNDDVFFHSSLNDTGKEDILNYIESLLIKEEKIEEE